MCIKKEEKCEDDIFRFVCECFICAIVRIHEAYVNGVGD